MEEEVGIKVTRLRRRLSVEADEVKSPSTQSTPTKKRGGRLAAKPQLELIAENAPDVTPKRTRKSIVKEVTEPVQEKTITPSRRSTRIRSNTSIVSETPGDVTEDKGTPSRRTTRLKSNTSLIAEPVNLNSPRAKRAARRNSQVGSDNEAPITPARSTRRTRNNSTSSIDKPVEPIADKLGGEIKEVIVEESENNDNDTITTERSKNDSPSLRKSPRLVGKFGRKSSSLDNDNKENEPRSDKKASETPAAADKSLSEPKPATIEVADQKTSEQINLSATSKNLIQELEEVPKKAKSIFNKSATAVKEPQIKTKRNRTKSWTAISVESPQESSVCSDSEVTKKINKKKNYSLNFSNVSGSGDGIMNASSKNDEADKEQDNVSLNSSTLSNKKKKKRHEMSMTIETETSVHEVSVLNTSENKSAAKLTVAKDASEDVSEEGNNLNSSKKPDTSGTQRLFEQAPSGIVQSLVFIEDSDSNQGKDNNDKKNDSGDQLVPVVDHQLVDDDTKNTQNNLSYEPMDIDETMPENVSLSNFVDKNDSASEKRKSMLNMSQVKNDSINKSKRKSGIPDSALESNIDEASTKSPRKSSITEMINGMDSNKRKKKSSVTNKVSEDTTDGIFNVSSRKSVVVDTNSHDESINKKANKSKRKSSISNVVTEQNMDEDSNNSTRKSLSADNKSFDEIMYKESNKSKRKSSLSNVIPDENTNETLNKSTRKSSVSDMANDENMDKSLNKSKRKSVTTMVVEVSTDKINTSILADDEDMKNKSPNKSKRKSSISNTNNDSMDKNNKSKNKSDLDKTENYENKSTLVLSQLKDVSDNEINAESNAAKDSEDSNDQLSKSVNVPNDNTEKDTDKKNISLTYSTSTPLQQKAMKKLGLQINSSIIASNSANKIGKRDTVNKSKKEASIMSEEDGSDSSEEEEDSEEESSLKNSILIDGEAEEANDDYESGDSRDEDEKEYEEENEIKAKGETLDSDEEESSDDSDYEKDSFIVSSDEEDKDLLSGSGDDLSMSADELTMTAKSKNKFNERKRKEQKKASREMYEARHKLNESDNSTESPKSKKNNRQRFDTSSSEEDEEVTAQPKKNRRQRINSSHDTSALKSDTDKSLSKKNKARRLSESVCDEDETNEKEITIRDENQADKIDPLTLLNVIKEEPKTPQKGLNISTVAVINIDEVEEVNVDENVSIMKPNQTSDPLQATIAENDEEDITDEGSISENEEITQNYESVLSNLNKSSSKKMKPSNISLDLNKKTKQAKEPIVDQLNLTQVKKSKKNKAKATENAAETKKQDKSLNKSTEKVSKPDRTLSEGSSDSIDMKLLFAEDSNNSEVAIGNKKQTVKETTQNEDDDESPGDFIPLKRSLGKTNILENMNIANKSKDESILNVSGKMKNKRKSFQSQETLAMGTTEVDNLGFFVDTTGTLADENTAYANTLIKNSAKKNNLSFSGREEIPLDDDVPEKSINTSVTNVEGSAKKKKRLSESQIAQETENETPAEPILTVSRGSAKKQKQKSISESTTVETENVNKDNEDVMNQELVTKKRKRKSSANQTIDEIIIKDDVKHTNDESITTKDLKKKRKISNNDEDIKTQLEDAVPEAQEQENTLVENIKKKSKVQHQKVNEIDEGATKKNKKRKERDDDDVSKISKVLKHNSFDKVHVPRLPPNILKQLDDKPKTDVVEAKKTKIMSTSEFVVEETKRITKPSNYLEESVYIKNEDKDEKKQKRSVKNPKVLPFIPTASTSYCGFTTNFKVNVISQETKFVAQSSDVSNFKNDYLLKKRIKKLGTFEMYKRQRNIKIAKF